MSAMTNPRSRPSAPATPQLENVTASSFPTRHPSWLRCDELAQPLAEIRHQLQQTESLDIEQVRARTKWRLRHEINFMGSERFRSLREGKRIFALPLGLADRHSAPGSAQGRPTGSELPIHLGRLCEAALLEPDQEEQLFERMNYLRQQAAIHRTILNPERPSRSRLELIDLYLALAQWHRDRILEANLRLVFSIVKKFVTPNHSFDELLSDGIIALIRSVEKFDFERGFRFSTYATQVVRRNAYRTVVLLQQERERMIGGAQDMELHICNEDRCSAISEKRWHELRSRLGGMLGNLDRREKFIIRSRFSLGSHRRVHTLQSLANRLGVSKERVRQLERRAMDKLRLMARTNDLAELER
tara:strand:- start:184 stop:1260 length:1077 start_codon:yes stop_codon:yes gene_type:complete